MRGARLKLLFGLIGAAIGLAVGDWSAALAGAALGVIAAMLWRARRVAVETPAADPGMPSPASTDLVRRVQALEKEVGDLRLQVRALTAAQAPSSVPDALPRATTASDMPAPAAALDAAAVAKASVPVPEPERAPTPTPLVVVEAGLELHVEPAARLIVDEPEAVPFEAAMSVASPALAQPSAASTDATPPTPTPAWAAPAPTANAAVRKNVPPPPAVPWRDRLPPSVARWVFGGNTIVKIGVLILFFGLAFLLRYTAERVSVPVEFRYAGVALVGAFLLGLGWRLRGRSDRSGGTDYGVILQGAGIGVFYLTALAALRLNPLLTPSLAFAFMAAVAVFGAVLAVAQDAPWLAFVSVAEGFGAPVLVATGSAAYVPLFSYMAILDAGILAMAWFKAWRPLNLVGAVATFALAGAWAHAHYVDADYAGVQAWLLLYFLLFTATGVLFARRALAAGDAPSAERPLAERAADALHRIGRVDSTLTFGVPLAAFTLQYLLVRDMPWGPAWAASAFALFHILLGGALMRGAKGRYALLGEAHVIVGTIFATLAIPLALEGVWTGATWAIEAAGMYWLGARQRRTYARVFALVVMLGAALRLAAGLDLDFASGVPLITGSTFGMAMLAVALCAMDVVRRRMPVFDQGGVERVNAVALPLAAAFAFTALTWMLLPVLWAGAATAWIAFACAASQQRLAAPALRGASVLLHLVALAAMTLSLQPTAGDAVLAQDWRDLAAAVLIGAALLATGWLGLRDAWRAAAGADAPRWSLASGIGLASGIAVVSASLLFVMTPARAALVWPWIGVFVMWLGSRLRHPALALSAFALQAAAAAALVVHGALLWTMSTDEPLAASPMWGALALALAALLVGDLMRGADLSPGGTRRRAWWHADVAQALIVGWALLWWWNALPPMLYRALALHGTLAAWPSGVVVFVTLSSAAIVAIARWRDWTMLGRASLATVPLWILVAATGPIGIAGVAPSADLGWLAWPLALAWHPALLRLQARWRPPVLAGALHVAGFWLFVALASREGALRVASVGAPGSAWATLAEMLVPALVLAAISRPAVLRRWPLSEHRDTYLVAGCAPLALFLASWLWSGNTTAGDAAPLPYVPLLNPLEIGQGIALLALALWARALPAAWRTGVPKPLQLAAAGATAFALVTGMVLRACHHWAGVAWDGDALWASTLTQAALSVTWALVGVALMLSGHRSLRRVVWLVGAALLGVVVAKLFLVELADRGSLYRIVSFIVVGALMLVVGYFAPMPPRRQAAEAADDGAPDTIATEPGVS